MRFLIKWVGLDDRLLSSPSKLEGEDVQDLFNPNLVDLTFSEKYFPNFGSLRVDDFYINNSDLFHREPLTLFNILEAQTRGSLEDTAYVVVGPAKSVG